jgi:dolichyl-phosphate-mannose-protein mannosyltransferase
MAPAPSPARASPRALPDRALGLALVAAVAVLRAPGFAVGIVNLDECDFALFGRMVQAGAVPYLGVADIKPPLTYVAYHLAERLAGGPSFTAIHLLGVAAILATAFLLRAAARAWTGDDRAGWAAAWLSVLAVVCESPAVNAEILMNVPVAAALLAAVLAERRRLLRLDVASGIAIGVATLVKQQAGIALVALGVAYLVPLVSASFDSASFDSAPLRGATLRTNGEGATPGTNGEGATLRTNGRAPLLRVAALAAGFCLPWASAVAVAAAYDWPSFYSWVIARNLHQMQAARSFSWPRAAGSVALCLAATALPWGLAVRRALAPRDAIATALALLAALTWIPVSLGGRFYEHYFLQFAPPLALLGAPELAALTRRLGALGRLRRGALVALALLPFVGSVGYATARGLAHDFPSQDPKANAIAAWLRANTQPGDRIFLWGDFSAVYCLAERLPGTRYMRTAPHIGDFDPLQLPPGRPARRFRSETDIALTLADLAANRPAVVVDTSAADLHGWSRFPLADVADVDRYVREHYLAAAHPAGAVVYLRNDAGAERASDAAERFNGRRP